MTLQLKVGRSYRRRDQRVVHIMARRGASNAYPFVDNDHCAYAPDGKYWAHGADAPQDILEEVSSEPAGLRDMSGGSFSEASASPALTLCAGPGWKRRDGKIVTLTPTDVHHPWAQSHPWVDGGYTYTSAGLWSYDQRSQSPHDIIGRDLTTITPDYAEPPAIKPQPERVKILHEGAALTSGARDAEYGPPQINMHAAGKLKQLARELATRDISPAEWEALDMVMTKMSRLLVGTAKRDTYVDGAAYFAIAGEIALSI